MKKPKHTKTDVSTNKKKLYFIKYYTRECENFPSIF